MLKNLLFLFFIAVLFSCKSKKQKDNTLIDLKFDMIDADRTFSRLSKEKGIKAAYLEYIDSNGVMLRPNSLPLTGGNAIDFICRNNDTSILLTWEPKSASVSATGDMGFTYGIYSILHKSNKNVTYGTYVNIWKRQADGSWKFILSSENEGLE